MDDGFDPDVVICATGYLHGLEPLVGHLGVLDERGVPRASGVEPAAEGLRFIGFMSRPALIAFVARQSRRVAARIAEELERSPLSATRGLIRKTHQLNRLTLNSVGPSTCENARRHSAKSLTSQD